VFKTFKKGCRIWLKIASDDALFSTWDSSSRYVETPAAGVKNKIHIYHDTQYPSHLLLPVISETPEIMPVKPPLCEALPGAPRFVNK
jgi:predicted acyl esterase